MSLTKELSDSKNEIEAEVTKILYEIGAIEDKPEVDGDKIITRMHDTYKYERKEAIVLVTKKLPDNDAELIKEIVNKIMDKAN